MKKTRSKKRKQETLEIKISTLENLTINLLTPLDYIFYPGINSREFPKRLQKQAEKHGIYRGMVKLKKEDYKEIVRCKKQRKRIPRDIKKYYEYTPCGLLMDFAYFCFR
ncbi:hypothetical protein HN832_01310 [archaeon]|jgi:hypothetical protein|nr:hypothetical protein [archaeon]MBT4373910.1 hypothetical protein [archaeon]MBT4532187.1 hypothetical protein [archaeon]MBT7001140.1 hypothetical protein [archaeon]MBT7282029.1 hypothetical protein [archaeon]